MAIVEYLKILHDFKKNIKPIMLEKGGDEVMGLEGNSCLR